MAVLNIFISDTNVIEVIIELGDINDNPPEFLQDKYFIGVSQDAGVATTIITMQVRGCSVRDRCISQGFDLVKVDRRLESHRMLA